MITLDELDKLDELEDLPSTLLDEDEELEENDFVATELDGLEKDEMDDREDSELELLSIKVSVLWDFGVMRTHAWEAGTGEAWAKHDTGDPVRSVEATFHPSDSISLTVPVTTGEV